MRRKLRRGPRRETENLTLRDMGAEVVLLLGGARAILLQVANQAVGAGVAEHSNFADHPLDRLKATMTYVYAVVYGTPAQRAEVVRRVNDAHVPVVRMDTSLDPSDSPRTTSTGTGAGSGSSAVAYSAFNPQLQLWVAATLYDTAVQVYERVFGVLDPESAKQIYRDYAVIGSALQVPDELWPADRQAFQRYWDNALTQLHTNEAALRIAQDLFHPREAPIWLRAALPFAQFMTAGLLPEQVREAYGLPWTTRSQWRFDRTMRVFAAVYPRLPKLLRFGLKNHYLAGLATDP